MDHQRNIEILRFQLVQKKITYRIHIIAIVRNKCFSVSWFLLGVFFPDFNALVWGFPFTLPIA